MCGLIGVYNCHRRAYESAIQILHRLEYRGYDSAGLAVISKDGWYEPSNYSNIKIFKSVGKVADLETMISSFPNNSLTGEFCIAHTRWATNGPATKENCHPHISRRASVSLVHNGIIENEQYLKSLLPKDWQDELVGDTDSEILANYLEYKLIEKCNLGGIWDPEQVFQALSDILSNDIVGTYGLAIVVNLHAPSEYDKPRFAMYGFHRGNPLVLGESDDSVYLCSDLNSIKGYAKDGVALDPGCNVMVTSKGIRYSVSPPKLETLGQTSEYDFKGYNDYTHKEICTQYETLNRTLVGRVENHEVRISAFDDNARFLKGVTNITIVGEGTSYHAGLIGRSFIEEMSDVRVDVELASEFVSDVRQYSDSDLIIFISQSGETADVIRCARECKSKLVKIMAITNGVESQLSRMVDFGVYLRCGVEIGVASTKAFTSTVMVLWLLACKLGRFNRLPCSVFDQLPYWIPSAEVINEIGLKAFNFISDITKRSEVPIKAFVFLGKGVYKSIAMEAALKMNELSYIPSLSYSSGSLKHGPLGLVDDGVQFIILEGCNSGNQPSTKICSDQLNARKAHVHIFSARAATELGKIFETSIYVQFLAYHMAKLLKNDIDKPRNLAKSVTVM